MMQALTAKELLIGLLICLLAFFGGRVTKQCSLVDISEQQAESKKLEQELIQSQKTIDDLANSYAEQSLINQELKTNPIIKWKDKIIKVPASNCDGVIGTDEANKFNDLVDEIKKEMLP